MPDDDKRRIGKEIKRFISMTGMGRERFAEKAGLGKSTIDKLVTGIYSDRTLDIVLERTGFRIKTLYASDNLGSYSKADWEGYVRSYLMLHPAFNGSPTIIASSAMIDWDDTIPGLVLSQGFGKDRNAIGALWIPASRSPLIYVQPTDRMGTRTSEKIGVRVILSTMVGEAFMRGLMLAVSNVVANAYVPVALPIVLQRLDAGAQIPSNELGLIERTHPRFSSYSREIQTVLDRQYGQLIRQWGGNDTIEKSP